MFQFATKCVSVKLRSLISNLMLYNTLTTRHKTSLQFQKETRWSLAMEQNSFGFFLKAETSPQS